MTEVLLSGASGCLGRVLLGELVRTRLALGVTRVWLLDPSLAERPIEAEGHGHVVGLVPTSSRGDALGLLAGTRAELTRRVTHVVHVGPAAEMIDARHAAGEIRRALALLELSQECTRIVRHTHVSSAFVEPSGPAALPPGLPSLGRAPELVLADLQRGTVDLGRMAERHGFVDGTAFMHALTEHLFARRRASLRIGIVRPSLVGPAWQRPEPGFVTDASPFVTLLRGLASDPVREGSPLRRLDVVPVDVVAAHTIDAAFELEPAWAIRRCAAGPHESLPLDELVLGVREFFRGHPLPRAHRLPGRAATDLLDRLATGAHVDPRVRGALDETFHRREYLERACEGVYRHVLELDPRAVVFAGRMATRRPPRHASPGGTTWLHHMVAAGLRTTARGCLDGVSFDPTSFDRALSSIPDDHLIVLAPSHRSYIDFLACPYLFYAHAELGLRLPEIAAAREFARMPGLGRLFSALGAFYLERGQGASDERLLRAILDRVERRVPLQVFVEGTRSRSGEFLPPRRGFLRSLQATRQHFAIVPIAFSYDRVPEEGAFLAELAGHACPRMRVSALVRWFLRVAAGEIDLGRVHLAAGEVLVLDDEADIPEAAHELVARLQAATACSTHHLRAFGETTGVDPALLRREVERRGGHVYESPLPSTGIPSVREHRLRSHWMHHFYPEARVAFGGDPHVTDHLRRHAHARPHDLDAAAECRRPIVAAILRGLFERVVPEEIHANRTGDGRERIVGAFRPAIAASATA